MIESILFLPDVEFQQLISKFDSHYGILWIYMHPKPRPSFNENLLKELSTCLHAIKSSNGMIDNHRINYVVLASAIPGIFNLGGDLELFRNAIINSDRDILLHYGVLCIDNLYLWYHSCNLPLTTITLVQGDALGGGFEVALSSTILISENSARMGFPEILFNLFPGMGAYSFLSRKVGFKKTEELIFTGNLYTASQLHEMGVVDIVVDDGKGEASVYEYIYKHSQVSNARRAVEMIRREIQPITYDELMRVINIWVDTALNLSDRELKKMNLLVRAQNLKQEGKL